ncbi:UNVERIFIED_CONTAM: hypothetical protein Cloal_2894 [Acetivibrio alkalicellulosi]
MIKYLVLILILIPLFYTFSYAKYCLKNNNIAPLVGATIIILASLFFPIFVLFFR